MVATVQKPAPDFAGTVVEAGEFKDVTLSTYAGKWYVCALGLQTCVVSLKISVCGEPQACAALLPHVSRVMLHAAPAHVF